MILLFSFGWMSSSDWKLAQLCDREGLCFTIEAEKTEHFRRIHRIVKKCCAFVLSFQNTQSQTSQPFNQPIKTQISEYSADRGHGHDEFRIQTRKKKPISTEKEGHSWSWICEDGAQWQTAEKRFPFTCIALITVQSSDPEEGKGGTLLERKQRGHWGVILHVFTKVVVGDLCCIPEPFHITKLSSRKTPGSRTSYFSSYKMFRPEFLFFSPGRQDNGLHCPT